MPAPRRTQKFGEPELRFYDKNRRRTNDIRRAKSFQAWDSNGMKIFASNQKIPDAAKGPRIKGAFIKRELESIEAKRNQINLNRKITYRKREIARLERLWRKAKLSATKAKHSGRIARLKEELEGFEWSVVRIGITREPVKYVKTFSRRRRRTIEFAQETFRITPISFNRRTVEDSLDQLEPLILEKFYEVWDTLHNGQRHFTIRLLYREGKSKGERGFTGSRREGIHKRDSIPKFVRKNINEAKRRFARDDDAYFKSGFMSKIAQWTGFGFEYIRKKGEYIRNNKTLERRVRDWRRAQARKKVNKKKMIKKKVSKKKVSKKVIRKKTKKK